MIVVQAASSITDEVAEDFEILVTIRFGLSNVFLRRLPVNCDESFRAKKTKCSWDQNSQKNPRLEAPSHGGVTIDNVRLS